MELRLSCTNPSIWSALGGSGYFIGTGTIMPHVSKEPWMMCFKTAWYQLITKHNKVWTMCMIVGMYQTQQTFSTASYLTGLCHRLIMALQYSTIPLRHHSFSLQIISKRHPSERYNGTGQYISYVTNIIIDTKDIGQENAIQYLQLPVKQPAVTMTLDQNI